jgi:hypothetical protein
MAQRTYRDIADRDWPEMRETFVRETRSITTDDVRPITVAAQLNLPPDRLKKLTATYSTFLAGLAKIRAIDIGDHEPATITFDREAVNQ